MAFAWFVARRYLVARRRQAFISLISAVSVLGVGVGVMALIIALALMTGVQTELRDRLIGSAAHVTVQKWAGDAFGPLETERPALELPGVVGVAPAVTDFVMFQVGDAIAQGQVKGIVPTSERTVSEIADAIESGSLDAIAPGAEPANGIVLGGDLAARLGVEVGSLIWVHTAAQTSTPAGLVPRKAPMRVVGTFRFGVYQIDEGLAYMSLAKAESLFDRDGPDLMQLRLDDMDRAPAIREQLEATLGPDYYVQDWIQLNGQLYSALWLEKVAISLAVGLIVMVAALNIVASLILLVMEKTRDVAILRTMGAPAALIRRIFVLQGLTIGIIGTGVGAVLGLAVSLAADHYQLIAMPSDVYQITYLPFRVEPFDVTVVVVSAIVICLLATIYPSRQAGRIDPAEALRNQ